MGEREIEIRAMSSRDVDSVLAIEESIFPTPWPRECFEREAGSEQGGLSRVALSDGRVIGYVVSWIVADELHIGNLAVTKVRRGAGIGTELVRASLEEAVRQGVRFATLEVRASNDGAIRLYERFGFRQVAMMKRYYPDNGEDAVVMMAGLTTEEA